ncbi:hypothetical protein [Methyloceanibacter sp.]|uniref:hypothetical protein n=1 Tax=Methyloceanibacter sp. TaxID=1965321 RepID=UPI002C1715B3|nr:hypothetical protein [Methyloceanibacter sp.]HML91678.1 hypothetical protein [Methyloceanibacter sp.]
MKGFDFKRFQGFDVFGMNAAYRYWDSIGWYPQYYACLDIVVGVSHKDQIARLIAESDGNGIRQFLLRENLIDELGDVANLDRVRNFDVLMSEFDVLSAPSVSTGSHCAAWAECLGYREIFLLGIDCNYVEIIPEAKRGGGIELEIVKAPEENPNYFFADYQQPGDKFNIPNPNRAIHLHSWREVAVRLDPSTRILNANPVSKVDAFDFCSFDDVESRGDLKVVSRAEVLEPGAKPDEPSLTRKFGPEAEIQFDESRFVYALITPDIPVGILIDVGLQLEAFAPFAGQGWTVFALPGRIGDYGRLGSATEHGNNVNIFREMIAERTDWNVPVSNLATADHQACNGTATDAIDTVSLDDFVVLNGLTRVDVLSIAADGAALTILRGLNFSNTKPAAVLVDFDNARSARFHNTSDELVRFFVRNGYHTYVSEWHSPKSPDVEPSWHCLRTYPCDIPFDGRGKLVAVQARPSPADLERAVASAIGVPGRSREESGEVVPLVTTAETSEAETSIHLDSGYVRFVESVKARTPLLYEIAHVTLWGLRAIKNRIFGLGGLALVVIAVPLVLAAIRVAPQYDWAFLGFSAFALFFLVCALGAVSARRRRSGLVQRLSQLEGDLRKMQWQLRATTISNKRLERQFELSQRKSGNDSSILTRL